ncbi:alpha-glucosidase [Candidatus Izemoplasma sp. B36]|uniref:alpha-glucosidase n=1 Tax=Candidatus Izemoplasma sp. B36 TaxID=3242468 RepID=UPI00355765E9
MIESIENGFRIVINNKILLEYTLENPSIFLGEKDLNIDMLNGEFEIRDNTSYYPLLNFDIEDNSIIFDELKITIIEDENKLVHLQLSNSEKPLKLKIKAKKEEKIFGLGENFTSLNIRGEVAKNWVEEHITRKQIYNKIIRRIFRLKPKKYSFDEYKTYYKTPTYISTSNYFLHVETSSYGKFDFSNEAHHLLTFLSMPKEIVIGYDNDLLSLNGKLCMYRGIMPKLPEWIYDGMILAIQGGTDICDQKANIMLDAGAKINGIWSQDWCGELFTFFGKQVLWNWKVDDNLYPNLKKYIEKWGKQGIKFLSYINPYLNANEEMFEYAKENNYLVTNEDNTPFLTKATSFDFGIVDLTKPEAYEWYKSVIKNNYIKLGIMGWMADFGEYLPVKCKLYKGTGEELHNSWPDLWMKLNREAIEESNKLGQIVFFNRAGYKDTVKYTTLIWNGDQHVDFTDDFGMGSVVRASLSLSLSGIGFSHSDIGGYTTVPAIKRSKELYMRWMEMNTFTPVLRGHEGNKPWVNKQFDSDDELIKFNVKFSNIHYLLKDYLKHVENEYQTNGYPMIRPLFLHYDVYSENSYLLGSDLLVQPVVKKRARKVQVTIPSDGWIHIFTGKAYNKGIHTVECPIGNPPVFYKKDSKFSNVFINITKYIGG